jgi:hypothetical protein
MPQTTQEKGLTMEPNTEALRLSAMIALFVGAFILTLSIDNFHQQKLPTQIGEADCTWWRTNFGGCGTATSSLSALTKPPSRATFNM